MEEEEKKCFKCENILPLTEFYKHPKTKDGFLNKCKNCSKKDVREREKLLKSDPKWVEGEKKRQRDKYFKLNYKGKYKQTTEAKRESIKKYLQKFPEKGLAHKYTEIFLTKNKGLILHHWSYNQDDWLDVIELSIKDHSFLHRYMVYDQERMVYRTIDNILLDTKEKHLEYFEVCKTKYEH